MAILNIEADAFVQIPELRMDNGKTFSGKVMAIEDGELIVRFPSRLHPILDDEHQHHEFMMTWESGDQTRCCPIKIVNRLEGKLHCQPVIDEKREAVRVHCDFDLFFTQIATEDLASLRKMILGRVNPIVDPESEADDLMRTDREEDYMRAEITMIRRLLEKLTLQVEVMTQTMAGGGKVQSIQEDVKALQTLDCSATGLAICHGHAMAVGSFLKMRLEFYSVPKIRIDCLGVVIRCEAHSSDSANDGKYNIGIRFSHIQEANRERIVRHLFIVQRNLLRNRHREAS